jgi:exopolysaccharide biosynthesis polyprenyl glycosylphosphotransferase
MYQQQVACIINILMLVDGLVIIAGGYAAAYCKWKLSGHTWAIEEAYLVGAILMFMFVANFVMGNLGLYSDRRSPSFWVTVRRLLLAVGISFLVMFSALFSLKLQEISRGFVLIYAGFVFAGLLAARAVLEVFLEKRQRTSFNSRQILLVGDGERLTATQAALDQQKSWGHQVVGVVHTGQGPYAACDPIDCLGDLDQLKTVLVERSVDEVIFALEPECTKDIKKHLRVCEQIGVPYKIVPALFDTLAPTRFVVEHIQNIPVLSRYTTGINANGLLYKRLADILFGLVGVALLALMYPVIALAIKADSPGPVFFRQKRIGQNGRIFRIFKFRTMYLDAERRKQELMAHNEMQGLMFKMENDPRITKVGRFLRKTSLDEFPQFINVLSGEMSLVGTRPPTPDEVVQYEAWHRRRISMKPGITGLWQVSGRNKITDFNEVVNLDLAYIDQWSFLRDLIIIFKTVWVVLKRKGAS